tara:strand:+ start:164 stop:1018 length:855 start_codon:yes stop_codon:yes gene_type:complete
MIGNNRIGCNGRLGNQMFQYASMRGIASVKGFDWVVPPENYDHTANYALFETFKMTNVQEKNIGFVEGETLKETIHCYDENLVDSCSDNTNLDGFFQTEKYFENIVDEIRSDFTFKDEYLKPCKEFIDSLDTTPIFLHVRRGDAIGKEHYHPVAPMSYYVEALKRFNKDTPCFVFSDDLDWCKSQELFKSDRFLFNDNIERYDYQSMDGSGSMQYTLLPHVDLCLMSLCSGAIIVNSSFSWWGAWLQNNRGKVIASKPWFGPSASDLDTSDVVPDHWEIIDWSK